MPSTVRVKWHGDEVKARFRRAVARGTLGIAERISAAAKRNVHVVTGTLRRSIHTAMADGTGVIPATAENVKRPNSGALVEVGSWIAYACVEEVGRQHRYMQPSLEMVAPTAVATMMAAFAEEGFHPHGAPGSTTVLVPIVPQPHAPHHGGNAGNG